MNKRKHILLLTLLFTLAFISGTSQHTLAASDNMVISQVYGGGGNSGATYTNDFIELFNRGTTAVNITGWTVQYASSSGTSWQKTELAGVVQPGQYYLVQEAAGSGGTTPLPTPDAIGAIAMSGTAGKVALVSNNTTLTGSCPGGLVDQVGYNANCYEGAAAAPGLSNTTADLRADNGCTDTDENSADFATGSPMPRNTASPLNPCGSTATPMLMLNEIVVSTTGTDREFIEVSGNAGDSLNDIFFLEVASGGAIDTVLDLSGGTIPADGFWVATSPEAEAILGVTGDFSIANNTLTNNPQTYLLVQGFTGTSGNDIDANNDGAIDNALWSDLLDSIAVIDASSSVIYGSNIVGPDGSFLAAGGYRCPDIDGAWTLHDFSDTTDYTPGTANACPQTEIIINEIMQNPAAVGDSAGEWFELYNPSDAAIDINGWTIADNGSDNHLINNGGPLLVPAGGYLVLGNNADSGSNGGVTVDYSYGGSWFLSNSDDEVILLDSGLNEVDRVEYDGGPSFPDPTGVAMALIDPALDNNVGSNWCEAETPYGSGDLGTPGTANDCDGGGGGDEPQAAFIHKVQGSGPSVAINGPVLVTATVVADYQGSDQLSGFFIQEEDSDIDADANTSEGIFVYCGGCAVDVAVGDQVQVTGLAEEFFGMSQIDVTESGGNVAVVSSGNVLPTASTVDLPANDSTQAAGTFENVEGMLVTFSDTLVVSEYFELARYGQLVLTADARPPQFTDANEPSVSGYASFLDTLNSTRIILDDDNNIQNDAIEVGPDEPYYWPRPGLSISNSVRGGDSIDNLTGVMHWSFAGQSGTDAWRVRPVDAFDYNFTSNNPRTGSPDDVGGSLKVASFNVLNYFTTINSRGADSQAELDRQREKIAAAICAMNADVVGLIEIENNGSVALQDLLNGANGINANCGLYDYIDTGVIGTDEIAVAFIYRSATVSPLGSYAVLDSSVDARFDDTKNRPALAQTFVENATNGTVTVVVNHLKSKGSACDDVGDPDLNDGQGNCNETRRLAAEAMVDWLATDPTGSGDADVLIIGDLNSYRNEDPIDALEEGADDTVGTSDDYTDLLDALIGPSAYSYVFDGQLGYLDYALANQNLFNQVTGVTVWHINADEIPVFDYNDEIDDGSNESSFERESSALPIYEPNAYRASDHDPVIIGLDLNASPVCSAASASQTSLWPPDHRLVTLQISGVTDAEGDALTYTINGIFQDEAVNAPDSGNTAPDGRIGVGNSFQVRAERVGEGGNGRVYHITFTVMDSAGGSCSGEVTVSVPMSKNGTAVDDGALYDSTLIP